VVLWNIWLLKWWIEEVMVLLLIGGHLVYSWYIYIILIFIKNFAAIDGSSGELFLLTFQLFAEFWYVTFVSIMWLRLAHVYQPGHHCLKHYITLEHIKYVWNRVKIFYPGLSATILLTNYMRSMLDSESSIFPYCNCFSLFYLYHYKFMFVLFSTRCWLVHCLSKVLTERIQWLWY
jgi:hypothetical protein